MEIQPDGVITDGLVPRALPLAGSGQTLTRVLARPDLASHHPVARGLLLVHALGHDLIDRTLDERRRDRLTPSTPDRRSATTA